MRDTRIARPPNCQCGQQGLRGSRLLWRGQILREDDCRSRWVKIHRRQLSQRSSSQGCQQLPCPPCCWRPSAAPRLLPSWWLRSGHSLPVTPQPVHEPACNMQCIMRWVGHVASLLFLQATTQLTSTIVFAEWKTRAYLKEGQHHCAACFAGLCTFVKRAGGRNTDCCLNAAASLAILHQSCCPAEDSSLHTVHGNDTCRSHHAGYP